MSKKLGIIPFAMILILIFFPNMSLAGAERGIDIWWQNIVPSLFPFMTVSTMLVGSGVLNVFSKRFSGITNKIGIQSSAFQAFIVGILSGFPVGAGMIEELYKKNEIEKSNVSYAAAICSFCSPIFMLSTVGLRFFGSIKIGIILMAVHYVSFLMTVLLIRNKNFVRNDVVKIVNTETHISFGKLLALSVEKSAKSVINVGGYIVLFSVLIEIISKTGIFKNNIIGAVVSSLLELSNGCAYAASACISNAIKFAFVCFAVSWGGLCVICQISGFISECGVSSRKLLIFKAVQGVIAFILGAVIGGFNFIM